MVAQPECQAVGNFSQLNPHPVGRRFGAEPPQPGSRSGVQRREFAAREGNPPGVGMAPRHLAAEAGQGGIIQRAAEREAESGARVLLAYGPMMPGGYHGGPFGG